MRTTTMTATVAAATAALVLGGVASPRAEQGASVTTAAMERTEPGHPFHGDQALADRVFAELVERSGQHASIDVSASGGAVTLSGTVPSEQAKQRAMRTARRTAGVTEVRDQLRVAARPADQGTPPADAQLARDVAKAVASKIAGAKAGEDWWFSGWRVEGPHNAWNFVVEADRGAVTLEGDVPRAGIVTAAVKAARDVAGVRNVDSQLELPMRGLPPYPHGYGYYAPYSPYAPGAPFAAPAPAYVPPAAADEDTAREDRRTTPLRGEVTGVDPAKNTLTVSTPGGPVTVPLPDAASSDLAAGDRVQVDVAIREQPRRSE